MDSPIFRENVLIYARASHNPLFHHSQLTNVCSPIQLLSFRFTPHTRLGSSNGPSSSRRYLPRPSYLSHKSRWLHASSEYKFVLKQSYPLDKLERHMKDVDEGFDWVEVEEVGVVVNAESEENNDALLGNGGEGEEGKGTKCPICLDTPRAPRMTKCGHLFCYPCVLHFLELSELETNVASGNAKGEKDRYRGCPVCGEGIWGRELKRAKFWKLPIAQDVENTEVIPSSNDPSANDKVKKLSLTLMERSNQICIPFPQPSPFLNYQTPLQHLSELSTSNEFAMRHSKFVISTRGYLLDGLKGDMKDLDSIDRELAAWSAGNTIPGTANEVERAFVDRCKRTVGRWIERIEIEEEAGVGFGGEGAMTVGLAEGKKGVGAAGGKGKKKMSDPYDVLLSTEAEDMVNNTSGAPSSATGNPTTYTFYQASNGAMIFLSPLDNRIIRNSFQDGNLPRKIVVDYEHIEWLLFTDDMRRRYRWLGGGIPIGAEVGFVEMCGLEKERKERREKRKRIEDAEKLASNHSNDSSGGRRRGWEDELRSLGIDLDFGGLREEEFPANLVPVSNNDGSSFASVSDSSASVAKPPAPVWVKSTTTITSPKPSPLLKVSKNYESGKDEQENMEARQREMRVLSEGWEKLFDRTPEGEVVVMGSEAGKGKGNGGRKKPKKNVLILGGGGEFRRR